MQVPREVLRGGSTSGAPPSALPLFLSEGWVGVPSFPARGQHLRCTTLCTPPFSLRGVGGGTQFPCERGSTSGAPPLRSPHGWAYPAHTRGSFRFTTKGTKGVPGLPPLDPERGARCPPCGGAVKRRATPPNGGFRHNERPICPPTPSGQTGLLFSRSFFEGTLLAVNLRRGEFEVQDVKKS